MRYTCFTVLLSSAKVGLNRVQWNSANSSVMFSTAEWLSRYEIAFTWWADKVLSTMANSILNIFLQKQQNAGYYFSTPDSGRQPKYQFLILFLFLTLVCPLRKKLRNLHPLLSCKDTPHLPPQNFKKTNNNVWFCKLIIKLKIIHP